MTRADRRQSERGDTLVEVLMAVIVVGVAFVGILMGLGTSIRLSGVDRSNANIRTLLTSSAESVKSQPYVPCPGVNGSSYNPASGVTVPSGYYLEINELKFWNGTSFQTTCPATDQGLQLVGVKGESPDAMAKEFLTVVKRSSS